MHACSIAANTCRQCTRCAAHALCATPGQQRHAARATTHTRRTFPLQAPGSRLGLPGRSALTPKPCASMCVRACARQDQPHAAADGRLGPAAGGPAGPSHDHLHTTRIRNLGANGPHRCRCCAGRRARPGALAEPVGASGTGRGRWQQRRRLRHLCSSPAGRGAWRRSRLGYRRRRGRRRACLVPHASGTCGQPEARGHCHNDSRRAGTGAFVQRRLRPWRAVLVPEARPLQLCHPSRGVPAAVLRADAVQVLCAATSSSGGRRRHAAGGAPHWVWVGSGVVGRTSVVGQRRWQGGAPARDRELAS